MIMLIAEISINNPSGRYKLDEVAESLYSYKISLTITGVKTSDLGNYTCRARNSYGEVRGTISLERMSEPKTTPQSTEENDSSRRKYRYKAHNKKSKNPNEKQPAATIYQIAATTEESISKGRWRTPPTYKYHQNSNFEETGTDHQTESFFSNSGTYLKLNLFQLLLVVITAINACYTF